MPIFERSDWHRRLKARAASPYPNELQSAILRLNRALIGRENPFSFRHQVVMAAARGDSVAVNNAVAKWLASYFDVVFAINRVLHPGEKRIVEIASTECENLPHEFREHVNELILLSNGLSPTIGPHADAMVRHLDAATTKAWASR